MCYTFFINNELNELHEFDELNEFDELLRASGTNS